MYNTIPYPHIIVLPTRPYGLHCNESYIIFTPEGVNKCLYFSARTQSFVLRQDYIIPATFEVN